MITGIDIVGLVLGVLPLVIEAAKVYSDGLDSLLDVAVKNRYDAKLEDFYDDFFFQTVYLGEQISQICRAVAADYSNKAQVPQSLEVFSQWRTDPELEKSLRSYFGSHDRYNEFTRISHRILKLLESLIEDKSASLTASEQDQSLMFKKITELAGARAAGCTSSSFLGRFRFSRHQKKRDEYITRLEKWNQRLKDLTTRADAAPPNQSISQPGARQVQVRAATLPSAMARRLIADLHRVLCRHQACSCTESRQVKLSLAQMQNSVSTDSSVCVDILVQQQARWQEASVTVTPSQMSNQHAQQSIAQICDALSHQLQSFSVQILVVNKDGEQSLWQMKPRPSRLKFVEQLNPMTLQELLAGPVVMNMKEKRKLALIFAYSLLLYHDSEWLSNGWAKEDIVFFHKAEDEPDLEYPFLSAKVNDGSHGQIIVDRSAIYHRNPDILALGILFVEIFNQRPIEVCRTRKEQSSFTVNTDRLVADRIAKKMDDTPFRAAIEACLSMNWVPLTQSADLHEEEVRKGVLSHIIAPLEQEVKWLTVN